MKLPAPPDPAMLAIAGSDIRMLPAGTPLWRLHGTTGTHALGWDKLRHFGPTSGRFDPHPLPRTDHHRFSVTYTALDAASPFAEVFQGTRVIDRYADGRYLTGWLTTRPLRLLNLTGDWPVRSGASYAINTGRHDRCREWAHAIHEHPPQVDGLFHHSAMVGTPLTTLFTPSADSFPAAPIFSRPIAEPSLAVMVSSLAERFGYRLV